MSINGFRSFRIAISSDHGNHPDAGRGAWQFVAATAIAGAVMVMLFTASACRTSPHERGDTVAAIASLPVAGPGLSGTYAGILPCADSPGILHTLVLRPDSVFYLRMAYQVEDTSNGRNIRDEIGRWSMAMKDSMVTLSGEGEHRTLFALQRDGSLRQLDAEGHPIVSDLNFTLRRDSTGTAFEPRLRMQGMYAESGDSATFQECGSALRMRVLPGGAAAVLSAAYRKALRAPGEMMLASLDGHIVAGKAGSMGTALAVDGFVDARPGDSCGGTATSALENVLWNLVLLGGQPVRSGANGRQASITFAPDRKLAQGSSGCNRFSGAYTLAGSHLTIASPVSTKMACPGTMEQERAFFAALRGTSGWRIAGKRLELLDDAGTSLATFEVAGG